MKNVFALTMLTTMMPLVSTAALAREMKCNGAFRDHTNGSVRMEVKDKIIEYTKKDINRETLLVESSRFDFRVNSYKNHMSFVVSDKTLQEDDGFKMIAMSHSYLKRKTSLHFVIDNPDLYISFRCDLL